MTRNYQSVVEPQLAVPGNLHELVRGQEQRLLKELEPVVRKNSVTLDMRQIERIDAEVRKQADEAARFAVESPLPEPKAALNFAYAGRGN